MANQIDCVEKLDRADPTTAIQYVGGRNPDGTRWKITQKDAIARIKDRRNSFYVSRGGKRVNVVVAVSRFGNEYLRTEADGSTPNNLLSLQSCALAY